MGSGDSPSCLIDYALKTPGPKQFVLQSHEAWPMLSIVPALGVTTLSPFRQ